MANQNVFQKLADKVNFFKFDLQAANLQKTFAEIFSKNKGDWSAIKIELAGKEGFTDDVINKLEFTHNLAAWSNDHGAVVSLFQEDEHTNSLRDIALTLNKAAFLEKVKAVAPGDAEADKLGFAVKLHRDLFKLEPTAMLVNMIRDTEVPLLNDATGANIAAVLSKQPDFNIRTTSVYELFKNEEAFKDIATDDDKTAVKAQLKTLQRLVAVSQNPDAVPALYNAKIQSAMQISALTKAQFITALRSESLDENTLAQIHHNAQQTQVRNEHFIMSLREAAQPTNVALIDKSLGAYMHPQADVMRPVGAAVLVEPAREVYVSDLLNQHNLSWDLLFGDADLCECGECNSVYSPASYFVELLNYLRNNNLDPNAMGETAIKQDPRDISGTPLKKLFDRRPDLGCLELTCQNTNTVLPYVDLVNEVMENYIVSKKPKPFNVDDETSGELLAEPQHTEYKAYCILKNEVYPFTLPYHQPVDAARIYLDFLDTTRYELIKTFRKSNAGPDVELTKLKDQALDHATDAECLELTREEYTILTKECFESIELMLKLKNNPAMTQQEYWQLIGGKEVHEYYGYDDEATMLGIDGLTLIKKEFLRRTGIDYVDLVDLLKTQTLNPCVPRGKAKAIMESLHFSYRFLQNYAKVNGLDKMAEDLVKGEKLAALVPVLKEQIDLLTNRKALSCPAPCDDDMDICDKDILCWVKCYFEKVGGMIVIENGRGCVDGEIFDVRTYGEIAKRNLKGRVIVRECKIYGYRENIIGSIDKYTGKITLVNNTEAVDSSDLKNLLFVGDKGEQGIFLLIDDEIYLIFTEKKDTCDLDTALLQHLDGTPLMVAEYDKIQRFIRLWRKLGWTIDEVDQAIVGLSKAETASSIRVNQPAETLCGGSDDCSDSDCDDCGDCAEELCVDLFDIKPELIHQLCAVNHLLDQTGLELTKLLSFWTTISCFGEHSLYQRLFLTHNVLGIDKIFKADAHGNYLTAEVKLTDHLPVVMASLNLSADDIQAIMQSANLDDKLTLANLSLLYRYRLLSRVLGLRIPTFLSILPLFGEIFKNAVATLKFMKRWSKMEDTGFTYQQLNYIIRSVDDEKKPFSPNEKTVLLLSKKLYDGLNDIDREHADLAADPDIADPAAQTFNIQQKTTSELVRTKASFLFDPPVVDKLIAYLEGTAVYTTNAPKNLDFSIPDTKALKNKLKYHKTQGSIQITGILTESEANDYKNLSSELAWVDALKRIQKQQAKAFKELFSGIFDEVFDEEKTRTDTEKDALKAIMEAGDVSVAVDKIPEGDPDPNTAPQKRVAFLAVFLPYLRQQLTHRFIIDSLAAYAGLEGKVTDELVSNILQLDTPTVAIYDVFEKIKDSAQPAANDWNGYLIPSADSGVTFIIKNSDNAPIVNLDGATLTFTAQEDPTNEWWSDAQQLVAGKLYKFATNSVPLENIFWKTPTSAITAIPSAALIPDFAPQQAGPALSALKKAALLVAGFELSTDEIHFLDKNKDEFDGLDFNNLTLEQWFRLEAYTRLRNSLPQTKINILEFWQWTYDAASDVSKLSEKIVELTTWKKDRIDKLIAVDHFNIAKITDYRTEKNLLKLQKALKVADKTGADIDLLFDWGYPTSNFNQCRKTAESIKNSIRARYNQSDWEEVVKPLHDKLRNHQRDALTAYLLQQPELIAWNVTDADGLFEYFLIDVQMDACMETSRIKQAISSVQLFIQRCFLGLEEEHNQIAPDILDRERWDWMQRYRVWEANRKVFLYPENWIECNLRDDKSPFFKELESELLQKDISKQNVADALKSYLYKVDDVANMEVVGLYVDGIQQSGKWTGDSRLHVFARTRNAPYVFYYRYFALDERNWYPWEKMQVDIPSYDVENDDGRIIENGTYLIPILWNRRLFIFFPQIAKKTKPNSAAPQSGSFKTMGEDPKGIENSKPISYSEIKMAWSEHRNGKWTQKQISNDALQHVVAWKPAIKHYTFVPKVHPDRLTVNTCYLLADLGIADIGAFQFDGSQIHVETQEFHVNNLPSLDKIVPIGFHFFKDSEDYSKSYFYSLQITNNGSTPEVFLHEPYFEASDAKKLQLFVKVDQNDQSIKFSHPFVHEMLGALNVGGIEKVFKDCAEGYYDGFQSKEEAFGYFATDTCEFLYHELKRPYSLYNWELFFHTPVLLADALSKAQHYEEAMKWFHYVFNPMAEGSSDERFWQFLPFKNINSKQVLDSLFNSLTPNTPNDAITEWRNKPFMPHVVARRRPVAYMKWVVMKYLDNLLAWGDYLFRQDTIETINQASQLYVLAGHILGPKPNFIPKRGNIKPQTYLGLLDKWDAFGNAMVELELAAPYSDQTTLPFGAVGKELAFANIYGMASTLYFCIPNNPNLLSYWDTVADRLYKIRHCLNIEGVFRKLPLFEPPIDPGLLVKAAAQGLSIASVLNDLNTPMPNYRFYYLLQKALELCNELKSLGGAMLSAIEKQDNESIALLRAKHENVMQNLVMEIKKKQLEEAQKNIESLQQNRKTPEALMKYYLKLSGLDESLVPGDTAEFNGIPNDIVTVDGDSGLKLIPFEKEDMDKASAAADWQTGIGVVETLASILHVIPVASADAKPFGIGAGVAIHGQMFGNAAQAVARGLQVYASHLTYQSSSAGKKAGFTRALQERIFQANTAGYELKQIDKQILAQQIRINIANQEINNQQKAIDNANEIEEFLKNKYSTEELYTWMRGKLKTLYHQVYNLAYDLAKKAEKTYCFERGLSNANFIQAGYFDAGRDGLLAGEQLYVGLKQLEAAFQSERGYDYEITKHVSLYQLDPLAIIQLRETGQCEFALPEAFFDLDYPGHYKRRIKSLSLSIPCVVGPYTGVNATLRLLENKFRNTAIGGKAYVENTDEIDERFSTSRIPINAVAVSSAQNDSGTFELNFKDERYLPFEGAGVISRWRLELPSVRQFDYTSISDVVIHLKYTAAEGGDYLKQAASKVVMKQLDAINQALSQTGLHVGLNMRHELSNEWTILKKTGTTAIIIEKTKLPYIAQLVSKTSIESVMFLASMADSQSTCTIKIDGNSLDLQKISADLELCKGVSEDIQLDKLFKLSVDAEQLDKIQELFLVVKFIIKN